MDIFGDAAGQDRWTRDAGDI